LPKGKSRQAGAVAPMARTTCAAAIEWSPPRFRMPSTKERCS
jgi:hypothetical protein